MDHGRFDGLARSVGVEGTRRAVLRFLAGSALGEILGGLPGAEPAEVAAKKHHGKTNQRRSHATPHRSSHRYPSRQVEAHGKGRSKGKKHHKKPKQSPPPLSPLPPGCQNCNECQMCQDGSCVADPALHGVRCLGSGAACGYCQGGQCAASALPPCSDGTCLQIGQCCSDEKRCPDPSPDSPTGITCVGLDDCCPDQKKCASGCVYKQACCEEERPQDCGPCGEICVNGTWRCSAEQHCPDGTCRLSECSNACRLNASCDGCDEPPAGKVFCPGQNRCLDECPTGKVINPITCQCECPPDSVLMADGETCCPRGRHCAMDGAGRPTVCCGEDDLCWAGGVCCPAALNGESLCHTEKCSCLLCREPIPEDCL